jgi:PIN domain nuclease of toxin-antitoxin system
MASLWEIAIKSGLMKLEIPSPLDILVPEEVLLIDIKIPHLEAYQKLPLIHKDPFDRLLIAQAQTEGLLMMTDDGKFKGYEISII